MSVLLLVPLSTWLPRHKRRERGFEPAKSVARQIYVEVAHTCITRCKGESEKSRGVIEKRNVSALTRLSYSQTEARETGFEPATSRSHIEVTLLCITHEKLKNKQREINRGVLLCS